MFAVFLCGNAVGLGKQSDVAGATYSAFDHSLLFGGGAGNPARKDFPVFGDELFQEFLVLVVNTRDPFEKLALAGGEGTSPVATVFHEILVVFGLKFVGFHLRKGEGASPSS